MPKLYQKLRLNKIMFCFFKTSSKVIFMYNRHTLLVKFSSKIRTAHVPDRKRPIGFNFLKNVDFPLCLVLNPLKITFWKTYNNKNIFGPLHIWSMWFLLKLSCYDLVVSSCIRLSLRICLEYFMGLIHSRVEALSN